MTYYLGRTGALTSIPDPEVGLSQSPERIGGTHQLLSGARVRDTLGRMRTWELSWTAIDLTTFGTLQSFYYGTGPYVFADPEQRNLLVPNVSSGGDALNSTAGMTTGTNVTVSTYNGVHNDGVTSLLMAENTSVVANQDVLTGTVVYPIAAGQPYTFSVWLFLNSNCPGHYAWMEWLDGNQALISGVNGGTIAPNTSGFSTVTATAPGTAAYARVKVRTSAANTAGATVFIATDSWQLEQGSSRSAWVPGVGVPLVTVETLSCTTPLSGICDAQMTLVQVG